MTLARCLRYLLALGLLTMQAWLVERLLRQRGSMLLDQEQLHADLARLERMARDLERRASTTDALAAEDPTAPPDSKLQTVRAAQRGSYQRLLDLARASLPPFPSGRFEGAGLVILAGGPERFPGLWVNLTMLRRVLGCQLPIEVWHFGPQALSERMVGLLARFGVECVDAFEVQRNHPMPVSSARGCRPYAIVHSSFREVVLLDADTLALIDPAELLAWPEFRQTGAVFWPDLDNLGRDNQIWDLCRLPYRDEPGVESGQVVVDKARGWAALQLTLHLHEHSDFYSRFIDGDRAAFHLAWRMLEQPYSMPQTRPDWVIGLRNPAGPPSPGVLVQHDFAGRALFHHPAGAGWSALGEDLHLPGFPYEAECRSALLELRTIWDGPVEPRAARPEAETPAERRQVDR